MFSVLQAFRIKGAALQQCLVLKFFGRLVMLKKNIAVLLGGFAVLRRPAKEMAVTAAAGVVLSILLRVLLPFGL